MVKLKLPQTALKHFWIYAMAIGLIALCGRAAMLSYNTQIIIRGDELEYVTLAEQLNQDGTFRSTSAMQRMFQGGKPGDPTAYRSPVLPAIIAGHFRLLGPSLTYPRITLILLSSTTCVLLAVLGKNIGSPLAGLIAGAMWAVWPTVLFSFYAADRLLTENLGLFFLVCHVFVLALARRSPTVVRVTLSGLLLGLAILTRGYLLFLLPLTLIFIAWWHVERRRRIALLFAVSAVILPSMWMMRNWIVLGKPILSTQTDPLYLGNNLWARGSFNGDIFQLGYKAPQFKVIMQRHPTVLEMSEIERSEMWSQEAINFVVSNPAHFGWLLMRKTLVFWAPTQTWSLGFYRWHYALAVLLPFAVLGIYINIRRGMKQEMLMLLLPIAAVFSSALLTYALDRYRFVIEPFIALSGAIGMAECGSWLYLRARSSQKQQSADNEQSPPQVAH